MAKTESFQGDAPHLTIGTLGDPALGRRMLAALVRAASPDRRSVSATDPVEFRTARHRVTQLPTSIWGDDLERLLADLGQLDIGILVVDATSPWPETIRRHLVLARMVGVPAMVVFFDLAERMDDELLDFVELELREMLSAFEFPGDEVAVLRGSTAKILEGDDAELDSVHELLDVLDDSTIADQRSVDGPFLITEASNESASGRHRGPSRGTGSGDGEDGYSFSIDDLEGVGPTDGGRLGRLPAELEAELGLGTEPEDDEPAAPPEPPADGDAEPRFLATDLLDLDGGPTPKRERRALVVGRRYRLLVDIGPEREGRWIDRDAAFPEHELPKDVAEHWLRVVFVEPHHAPEPQTGELRLPARRGLSTVCAFPFTAIAGHPDFEARIVVLLGNKVLQTALLRGEVLDDPADPPEAELRYEVETVVRARLDNTWRPTEFAGSLVLNRGIDEVPRALVTTSRRSILLSLEGVQNQLTAIRRRLAKLTYQPDDYAELRGEAMADLWRFLALQGHSLFEVIEDEDPDNPLLARPVDGQAPSAVQLVSTKNSSLVPIEFVYHYGPPGPDAPLCPHAETALDEGVCQGCEGRDDNPAPHVCPLGFWCTSRVIERHVHDRDDPEPLRPSEFRLRSDPTADRHRLVPLRSAGFAASDRVDEAEEGSIKRAFTALDDAVHESSFQARTWNTWVDGVATARPSLIVLLPHTTTSDAALPAMEIGDGQSLGVSYITEAHLTAPQSGATDDDRFRQPVVCLFGCNTEAIDIPFQGLVPKFRREGAAVVISTLTPVLGRHVTKVAIVLIEILAELPQEGTSLGAVFRRFRLRALAERLPVVLCLFAAGDADWLLAPIQE